MRGARDLELVLADADRLDEDDVAAVRIEHAHHVARRAREAAEMAARRDGADEDARIGRVPRHADAIAEDRAARVRARRIDADDADLSRPAAR